jgi:adenosine deaminase
MEDSDNKNVWRYFPKVELHRHLEGTFELKTLFHIAVKNKLPVPSDLETFKQFFQFPKDSKPDFQLFLSKFKNDWYRSYEDVYSITYESVKTLIDDGIFYIELRFNPEHFAAYNDFDRREVIRLIIEAGNKAAGETGVILKYLITFNRGKQEQKDMISLYKKIVDLKISDIVGIDLAGDEQNFRVDLFSELFGIIKEDGRYKTTIHAGEVTPPGEIWSAVALNAARIGHGTATIHDKKLQAYLSEHQIPLEQCITSNYQTGSWSDEKNHPIGTLYRLGVPVTINSDDPTIQDTDLSDDYRKAEKYFNFSVDDFVNLNLTALQAAFLSDAEKTALKAEYLKAVDGFKKKFITPERVSSNYSTK